MMPLGLRFLLRDPRRSVLAILGVGMAVLVVFVEMGFLHGVIDSHLRIVAAVRGELLVLDARREHLNKWDPLAPIRVHQVAAIEGVAAVAPIYKAGYAFRGAPDEADHRAIVVAFSPDDPPLELGWDARSLEALRQPGAVLFDELSRPIYGELSVGQDVWLEGHRLRLAGFVRLGPNVVSDGHLVMSEGTFRMLQPRGAPRMAVVRLVPGADPGRVAGSIAGRLGPDVEVFTKRELAERESAYLMHVAPLGLLFGAGMVAGLVVGLVICYQVLYVAVRRRLKAFATLKAMGFGERFIAVAIVQQAALVAAGGYAVGVALSVVAYRVLAARTGLLIELTWPRAATVALALLAACSIAGVLAAMKAVRTPPAELF